MIPIVYNYGDQRIVVNPERVVYVTTAMDSMSVRRTILYLSGASADHVAVDESVDEVLRVLRLS